MEIRTIQILFPAAMDSLQATGQERLLHEEWHPPVQRHGDHSLPLQQLNSRDSGKSNNNFMLDYGHLSFKSSSFANLKVV